MQNFRTILLLGSISLIGLTACRNVSFAPTSLDSPSKLTEPILDPLPPAPPPPVVVTPAPVMKSGSCVANESILSCLRCLVPTLPPPPPVPLTKALKLTKIMQMACPIPNKSYPNGYTSPAPTDIAKHLLACTADLYPETVMSAAQSQTMDRLLDETDDSLRMKMFHKFWYNPPYSDHFELYFGLEISEAASVFCLNGGGISGYLFTSEYAKVMSDSILYDAWVRNPAAQARWQQAQIQRGQLLSCLNKPTTPTPPPPHTTPGAKTCDYQSFEGEFKQGGAERIASLLSQGYKVAVETSNSCAQVNGSGSPANFDGNVKIVGYLCK